MLDGREREPKAHLYARTLSSRQQNLVQMLARERAHRGDAIVAEQELVMDDQLPARVEDAHVVIDETRGEYFCKRTECVVDS